MQYSFKHIINLLLEVESNFKKNDDHEFGFLKGSKSY